MNKSHTPLLRKIAIAGAALVLAQAASAAEITITGEVKRGSCAITAGAGSTAHTLPTVNFTPGTTGLFGTVKDINIAVTACPVSQPVLAQLSAVTVGDNGTLMNVETDNAATGVTIAMLDSDGKKIDLTGGRTHSHTLTTDATGSATASYKAQYHAGAGATAGKVKGVAQLTVTYE